MAGRDVTDKLIEQIEESGIAKCREDPEHIRSLKEQMCTISQNIDYDLQNPDDPLNVEQRSYELPDNNIIEVNHKIRFKSSEILFDPSRIGVNSPGIAEMAFNSIEKCDNDLKNTFLFGNIVLAGGSTLMPGFKERFEREIRERSAGSADTDIKVYADLHRKNAAWIGGSMIASFSTFKDIALSKDDYENGDSGDKPQAILKKSIN